MRALIGIALAAGLSVGGVAACGSSHPSAGSSCRTKGSVSAPRLAGHVNQHGVCVADAPSSSAPASAPPSPGPVSSAATLANICTLGWEAATSSVFTTHEPATGNVPIRAFQVTLINNSSSTAEVTSVSVAFYDTSGNEMGSVTEDTADSFITGGQSLNFSYEQGTASIPANAATCQLVRWTS